MLTRQFLNYRIAFRVYSTVTILSYNSHKEKKKPVKYSEIFAIRICVYKPTYTIKLKTRVYKIQCTFFPQSSHVQSTYAIRLRVR